MKSRDQCMFVGDWRLSKHLYTQVKGGNYSVRGVCDRRSVWLIFWRIGKHLVIVQP